MRDVGPRSELELIRSVQQSFSQKSTWVELGIGDDCAVLRPRLGWRVVVTTDLLLEGRHFRRDLHSPESSGHRCIARGLSDIAAMGADPIAAFLSLALPSTTLKAGRERRWLLGFLDGFRRLSDGAGAVLAGGDTGELAGGGFVADVVLVGQVPEGAALPRSGARAGDGIYITGALGGAAAELASLMAGRGRRAKWSGVAGSQPQSYPEPRLEVGRALRRRGGVTACIDVSDGLSTDLGHLCDASEVGAEVWEASLPVHSLAAGPGQRQRVLHGGEDYELLFTAGPEQRIPKRVAGVRISRIGEIVRRAAGAPVITLVTADGSRAEMQRAGWEHLRGR